MLLKRYINVFCLTIYLIFILVHNRTSDSGFFEQLSFGDKGGGLPVSGECLSGLEDLVNKIVEEDNSLFAYNSFTRPPSNPTNRYSTTVLHRLAKLN